VNPLILQTPLCKTVNPPYSRGSQSSSRKWPVRGLLTAQASHSTDQPVWCPWCLTLRTGGWTREQKRFEQHSSHSAPRILITIPQTGHVHGYGWWRSERSGLAEQSTAKLGHGEISLHVWLGVLEAALMVKRESCPFAPTSHPTSLNPVRFGEAKGPHHRLGQLHPHRVRRAGAAWGQGVWPHWAGFFATISGTGPKCVEFGLTVLRAW
jgi:hypothetical protein